jgi:glycosyltransferase involved in cell wall biosynthesis
MASKDLPSISILIPTLNAASVLEECLKSIATQDYPRKKIEIIIADGGSTDKTLEIAKKYGVKIYRNPLKTGEAGKAVALKKAKNELVALIDSDNVLPDKNWFKEMVEPFSDPEIIGSEPWKFTYRKQDGFIDRYCALLGINDPLCHFLGNYDRLNKLTGKWTNLPVEQEDKVRWLKVTLKPGAIPTIGANGTVLRREVLVKSGLVGDYLFDINIIARLANKKPVKFAKVKTGIIHLYCGSDIEKFIRKQKRRIKDYLYYQKIGVRKYPWHQRNKIGLLKFVFSCVTILPLLYQTVKGYFKKPDFAWLFHPLACWITEWVYGIEVIVGMFSTTELSRKSWGQ